MLNVQKDELDKVQEEGGQAQAVSLSNSMLLSRVAFLVPIVPKLKNICC